MQGRYVGGTSVSNLNSFFFCVPTQMWSVPPPMEKKKQCMVKSCGIVCVIRPKILCIMAACITLCRLSHVDEWITLQATSREREIERKGPQKIRSIAVIDRAIDRHDNMENTLKARDGLLH